MPDIIVSGFGEEEKEAIDQAADDVGMSTAEFARTRLRAGHRLWDAGGDFDVLEMQERLSEKEPADSTSSKAPAEPKSAARADRFEKQIKQNLPTSANDAVPLNELVETVSKEVVKDVVSDLKERGEVEYVVEQDGFVRK